MCLLAARVENVGLYMGQLWQGQGRVWVLRHEQHSTPRRPSVKPVTQELFLSMQTIKPLTRSQGGKLSKEPRLSFVQDDYTEPMMASQHSLKGGFPASILWYWMVPPHGRQHLHFFMRALGQVGCSAMAPDDRRIEAQLLAWET